MSSEFLLTSLIVVLVPGTGVIYTVSTGLFRGARASLFAALGCTVGILPHLVASVLGLSFILHGSAAMFQGIKLLGALYLLYLAWGMWRDKSELEFKEKAEANPLQIVGKAVLLNLLNPKLTLFFFAFLPLFVTKGKNASAQMLELSFVFMLMTLLVFGSYGVLASTVRHYVKASPHIIMWLRRSFAAAFAGLGIKLAFTKQ